jgi:beta-glucosidase
MKRPACAAGVLLPLALAALPAAAQSPSPDVDRRVDEILSKMTLEEKIDMLGGVDGFFTHDVPRLGVPRLKMADGPLGVRNFGPATAMAGGISLTATWNTDLAGRVGKELGRDARAKGVHFLLGPGVNLYRAPMNGRNFEYFGEDPLLAARVTAAYIEGVQSQGVSATVKHYLGNNSEFDRHNVDTILDERTAREIYLPAFEAAVKDAHVGAIMDAYNLTNGEHMTQNGAFNTDVARKDWGFDGVMMSDWSATYDAVAAANGGLDLEMPSARFMNREKLLPAIQKGEVSVATIDEKVRRILHTAARFGWLDRDQTDISVPRYNLDGARVALEAAREGMVLLKNEGSLLPLDKGMIKTIAVIGPDAYPAVPVGGGSARVEPFASVSILEGLAHAFSPGATVYYHPGIATLDEMADGTRFVTAPEGGAPGIRVEYFAAEDLTGTPAVTRVERNVHVGGPFRPPVPPDTASDRWTGYFVASKPGPHVVFLQATGGDRTGSRLTIDDKVVFDNWSASKAFVTFETVDLDATPHKVVLEHRGRSRWRGARFALGIVSQDAIVAPEAKELAAKADVVVVAAGYDNATESEGGDRTFRLPPGQDELIRAMAAANKKTIVVVTSGGGFDATAWLDQVPALVEAWYPGQEGGAALADLLTGVADFSGRLPVTFERRPEDNPTHDTYYPAPGTKRVEYKEGVFVGYRGYEQKGTKPLFPFGYGLSYTTFTYANLAVRPAAGAPGSYDVTFDVTNSGSRAGADVAQVYVGDPRAKVPRPPKELKGFAKVALAPGETRSVSVRLDPRAFSYWDVKAKGWRTSGGPWSVLVGRSSEEIVLRGEAGRASK